jgi:hypothetical protein
MFSLFSILLLVFLSSCLKEKPIERADFGEVQTIQVNMGETYQTQIFYDLENLEIIDTKDKDAWDLAFSGSDTSNHVILNTAKIMGATFLPNASLSDNLSISGVSWVYEHHEGDSELSPFYDWENKVGVYLINGGFNHLGQTQPNHALQLNLVNGALEIQYRRLNQQEIRTVTIPKMSNYNFYALNFANQSLHECEPPKNTWDIVFTVYTHIFDDNHAYAVNGVLLNRNAVEAAKISGSPEDLTFDEAISFPLSARLDVIGYDWKFFDMQAGIFTIVPNFFYLVQSRNSARYKLKFVNFYNEQGIKGFPTFERSGL